MNSQFLFTIHTTIVRVSKTFDRFNLRNIIFPPINYPNNSVIWLRSIITTWRIALYMLHTTYKVESHIYRFDFEEVKTHTGLLV